MSLVWVWLGFALYCLGSGSRWIAYQAVPPLLSGLVRVGIDQALLFGVWAGWCLVRRPTGLELVRKTWWQVALLAGTIFILPDVVIERAGSTVTGPTEALVFTLVPVVVVLAVAQKSFEFGMQADPRRLLGPALGGVFGAAFLIPFSMPHSVAGKLWLAALVGSVIVAGLAAVRLHAMLRGVPVVAAAALTSGTMALAGLIFCHGRGPALGALALDHRALALEMLQAFGMEAPLLLLGIWVLRELPPLAVVTRYLMVLLVTVVESYVLLHAYASLLMIGGSMLMAGSAGWLLRSSWLAAKQDDFGSTSVR